MEAYRRRGKDDQPDDQPKINTEEKAKGSSLIFGDRMLMYSAHCRQPGGTSRANQDDDQDLAKQRREKESHRG